MCPPNTTGNFSFGETFQCPVNNTEQFNATDSFIEQIATYLNIFYIPILILLGTFGNVVSIFVFYKSNLRYQSTSQYLTALAFSDTLFLLQLTAPWLNALDISGLFHEEVFCQIFVYISYACCCTSSWLVVTFTVERFVAVLYPLRRDLLCTVTRARGIIVIIIVSSFVINIPILKFAKPTARDCNIDVKYIEPAGRFNLVDTGISFSVPLTTIIVLNIGITYGVCQLEGARTRLLHDEASQRQGSMNILAYHNSQNRVTRMLLVVSTVYIMLNFPAYTMRIVAYAKDMPMPEYSRRWAALQQIALMFFNTNYGINFILYCLTGQNFRRALCQTIPCLRCALNNKNKQQATALRAQRLNSYSTSFSSNTDGTSSTAISMTPRVRSYESGSVITRWKFDNTRHARRPQREEIPMKIFATRTELYHSIIVP